MPPGSPVPSHAHQWGSGQAPKHSMLLLLNRTTQFSPNLGRCHLGIDIKYVLKICKVLSASSNLSKESCICRGLNFSQMTLNV